MPTSGGISIGGAYYDFDSSALWWAVLWNAAREQSFVDDVDGDELEWIYIVMLQLTYTSR